MTTISASSGPRHARRRSAVGWILFAGLVLFLHGRLTLPPGEFSNADVAGITYNADLLLDGRLPYVDSIDGKAPGTFFLAALVFRVFGRSLEALWWVFLVWQLLGAPAVWVAARELYGSGAKLSCAAATALFLGSAGQFDLNYSAWMTTAYAWAFAAALAGLRSGRWTWHLFAGSCAIAAFFLKQQAVTLVPLFPLLFLWARRRRLAGATRGTWGWWTVGALAGPAPLVVYYAVEGYLAPLVRSVLPLGAVASYAAMKPPISGLEITWRVLGQCYSAFPLAASLCLAALVVAAFERRRPDAGTPGAPVVPQLALIALSMFAGTLGGPRYYTHYLVQDLPGLALLAARPGLLAFLREAAESWRRTLAWAVVALLLYATGWHAIEYATGRASRRDQVDFSDARRAGEYIAARTEPHETIMVWGWTAWPTYYWADRRAPVAGYKSLGLLTDPNTNSAFFRSAPVHFRKGVHSDALLRAFVERPPAYFVYASYYTKHLKLESEPLFEWTEFRELIERDYVRKERFGDIRVFANRARLKRRED